MVNISVGPTLKIFFENNLLQVLLSACFYALSHTSPHPLPPTAEDAVTTTTDDDEVR